MALESGSRLGSYEISDLLGKGGMGEVYRARDTKLGREVAIKVLPSEFSQDEERLARLEREARMLAALNHPNIAAIYGLEQSDDTRFLVLELVEGDTLADQIKRGPIQVEESLKLALQIAEALEAAHEKGVIHRDLKPANIKITPDGKVKVLDFGLAKAFIGEQADVNMSNSPTLSMQATQAGMILGTAAYMSPEQASGEVADHRADVWAFGVVLFEMLTGRQMFTGKTASHVMGAVLNIEPEWDRLPAKLNPRIRMLLERSLEKEAKDRLSGISDGRMEIQRVLADPAGVFVRRDEEVAKSVGQSRSPWAIAGFLLGIVLAGSAVWMMTRPEPPTLVRFSITDAPNPREDNGSTPNVTITPDGSQIVYVGPGGQLYTRDIDQLDAVAIRGGIGINPFVSPDGDWVGFRGEGADATLKKVSIHGGPPVDIVLNMGGISGGTWGPDDSIIYGTTQPNGLFRVSSAGLNDEPEALTTLEEGESGHRWPEFLPDGDAVLFTVQRGEGSSNTEVALLDLQTGARTTLIPGGSNPHYAPTGHIVYGVDGTLRAVPFDLSTMTVTGDPLPVLDGVVTQFRGDASFSFAANGTLVYAPGTGGTTAGGVQGTFVWVDRQGEEETVPLESGPFQEFSLSPDGRRIAYRLNDSGSGDIWLYDLELDTPTRLTFTSGTDVNPIWTPEGDRVAFGGGVPVSWKAANGAGDVEALVDSPGMLPQAFSPDGTTLIVFQGGGANLSTLSLEGDRELSPLIENEFGNINASISPDGRWVAFNSDRSSLNEIYVNPFPDIGSGQWQVSNRSGIWPLWNPNGQELFYVGPEGLMAVPIETEPTFAHGVGEPLFALDSYRVNGGLRSYAVAPDGERFLFFKPGAQSGEEAVAETRINVVLNWFQELRERVPVD